MHLLILAAAYSLTIPAANWAIGHVGTVCLAGGPCLIPVAPGVMAPSGVLFIGAALLLRDLIQREAGSATSLGCIAAGAALSLLVAPPELAFASAAAFAISELLDWAVFTPLWRRRLVLALALSCAAGAFADSVAFLWLAFGDLQHLAGQVIGKLYAVLIFVGVHAARRRPWRA